MTQLQAQLPSNDSFPANSPFMVFDPSSYMCQFNADQQYFDEAITDTTNTPAMKLYFNSPLKTQVDTPPLLAIHESPTAYYYFAIINQFRCAGRRDHGRQESRRSL